jgi:hypothetical protein
MVAWKIGPTFHAECIAAGVIGNDWNGWSWDLWTGEIIYVDPRVPQAVRDTVAAVYAAHDPAAQTDPPTPYPPGAPPAPPP